MRIKFKTLRMFIREAARDQKQLNKINIQMIFKGKPAPFSKQTLELMNKLSDADLNRLQNRKGFIKWLATAIETEWIWPTIDQIRYIIDYILGADVKVESLKSFVETFDDAEEWYESLKSGNAQNIEFQKNIKVVYDFGNGYKIVKLEQEDVVPEGEIMQNCLKKGKHIISDSLKIYSLRNSFNKPRATIMIEDNQLKQIKGKQNEPPIKKYAKMVLEWLSTLKSINLACEDHYKTLLEATDDPNALFAEFFADKDRKYYKFLAEDNRTPPYILAQLAKNEDKKIRRAVAINHAVPSYVLEQLSEDEDDKVRRWVAGSEQTPPHVLEQLAKKESLAIRGVIAGNRATPPHVLEQLAGNEDKKIRGAVADNPSAPPHALEQLAGDVEDEVREWVAGNHSAPPHVLEQLAEDIEEVIRVSVAGNRRAPPHVLEQLAGDIDEWIRAYVADNLSTPPHILEQLAGDIDENVRETATQTLQVLGLL